MLFRLSSGSRQEISVAKTAMGLLLSHVIFYVWRKGLISLTNCVNGFFLLNM